jgi:hypothetical protein
MRKVVIFIFTLFTISTSFSQSEKSIWEQAFERFLSENQNQHVLYATLTYSGIERKVPFKVLFIYKLSESKGIVIFTDGKMITNYFEVFYSVQTNEISYYDIRGGLWEHEEAAELLDLVYKSKLQIIVCKDIRQIALPSDGQLKF